MARSIDADKLIKCIKQCGIETVKSIFMGGSPIKVLDLNGLIYLINRQPTIDTVKHGKWEEMRSGYGELEGWIHAECGREVKCMENFCPNCGADMRGETNGKAD